MFDIRDYANLPIGETQQGSCPNCGKRKFYVTRKQHGFAYICFRASCSLTPGFAGYSGMPVGEYKPTTKGGRSYVGATGFLTPEDLGYFRDRFGLIFDSPQHAAREGLKVAGDGRYVFNIIGVRDEYKGVVLRRPVWSGEPRPVRRDTCHVGMPKAITMLEPGAASQLSWAHSTDESTVVIVEDQLSALRIAQQGVTAVALLGTKLTLDGIRDLNRFRARKRTILALDPDALGDAYQICHKWTGLLDLRVANLMCDPKDYVDSDDLMCDLGIGR